MLLALEPSVTLTPTTLTFGVVRGDGPPQSRDVILRFHEKEQSEIPSVSL